MSEYMISQIYPSDRRGLAQVDSLLEAEGIRRDTNLDYICGMYDENYRIIATGSCFQNTLRCFAVSHDHQGEGLLNEIISHLMEVEYSRGNLHLFLYTKISTARFFQDLGFHEIARAGDALVFMENRKNGFIDYLAALKKETEEAMVGKAVAAPAELSMATPTTDTTAALVMNANPFTLGHQYLVETAAARCSILHLFIVSEDTSFFPFSVRKQLVKEGCAHLPNVILHDSGPYIISNATFPSYFLKDEETVIRSHARLDLAVFKQIAAALSITCRYVGEEPFSQVTGIYNQIMETELPKSGIRCAVIPRKEADGKPISASQVRKLIHEKNFEALRPLLPDCTLRYLLSSKAAPIIQRIQEADDFIHY